MSEVFLVPFMMGLLGLGHCLAMCGTVSTALCLSSTTGRRFTLNLFFNAGRISSYAMFGLILGLLGSAVPGKPGLPFLHYLSSFLIIALGFYLAGLPQLLLPLEKLGQLIWPRLNFLVRTLLPIESIAAAWVAGVVWGWLPCGLVYAAAAYALSLGEAVEGSVAMFAFGLGTLPALMLSGAMGAKLVNLIRSKRFRVVCGGVLIIYGFWSVLIGGKHGHQQHTEHPVSENTTDHSHHHP